MTITTSNSNTTKTISVPDAGRVYFGMSRNASYAAARRGDFPVVRIGKLVRVPIKALEQMLDNATVMTDVAG